MSTRRRAHSAALLLFMACASSAAAQGSPPRPPVEAPRAPAIAPAIAPHIAPDSLSDRPGNPIAAGTLRWRLAPLVDGARSTVVPVMPRNAARVARPEFYVAKAPVEFFIRIIVPDTTRLAPMPVLRPAAEP